MDQCTERYGPGPCPTRSEETDKGECAIGDILDSSDSTCPNATSDYDWDYAYSHTVGTGDNAVDMYTIYHYEDVKVDSDCEPGAIKH